jgi:hypothetical protein
VFDMVRSLTLRTWVYIVLTIGGNMQSRSAQRTSKFVAAVLLSTVLLGYVPYASQTIAQEVPAEQEKADLSPKPEARDEDIGVLVETLKHGTLKARKSAAEALGKAKETSAVKPLIGLMVDMKRRRNVAATRGKGRVSPRDLKSIPSNEGRLVRLRFDEDGPLEAARNALVTIGKPAVPELIRLLGPRWTIGA